MKMKEVQLLGVLAVIAGGIILLSLWGSQSESDADVEQDSSARQSAASDGSEQIEEDYSWLAEETTERAEDADDQEPGEQATNGDDERESSDEALTEVDEPQFDLNDEMTQRLEEDSPEDIDLQENPDEDAEDEEDGEDEEDEKDPGTNPEVYTVEKGDTLSAISREVYGSPGQWRRILEANEDVLDGEKHLRPEMELVIPPASGESNGRAEAQESDGEGSEKTLLSGEERDSDDDTTTYTVKEGDTLWSIAKEQYGNGKASKKILEANDRVGSPEELKEGMELALPE